MELYSCYGNFTLDDFGTNCNEEANPAWWKLSLPIHSSISELLKNQRKFTVGGKASTLKKVRSIRLYGKNYWLKFELVQLINMKHSNCAVYTGSFQWVNEEFSTKKSNKRPTIKVKKQWHLIKRTKRYKKKELWPGDEWRMKNLWLNKTIDERNTLWTMNDHWINGH